MFTSRVTKVSIYKRDCTQNENRKKRRILHCNGEIHELNFGFQLFWIPFVKSAMVGTKKCSMILQKHKDNKILPKMEMEINSKRNVTNQPPLKILLQRLLQSLTGTAKHKCCGYLCDCSKAFV